MESHWEWSPVHSEESVFLTWWGFRGSRHTPCLHAAVRQGSFRFCSAAVMTQQYPFCITSRFKYQDMKLFNHPALRSQSSCSGNPPQHHKHLEARIPNAEMFCPIHPFFHVKKVHLAKQLVDTKNVCFQSLCATVMPSKHLQFLDLGQAVLKEIFWEGRFSGAMLVLGRVINLRFGGFFSVRFQWCTPWKLFTYVGSNVSFHFETSFKSSLPLPTKKLYIPTRWAPYKMEL